MKRVAVDLIPLQSQCRTRGIGRYTRGLIEALARSVPSDVLLEGLAYPELMPADGMTAGISVRVLPDSGSSSGRWDRDAFERAVRAGGYDAAIVTSPQESHIVAPLPCPTIGVLYDLIPEAVSDPLYGAGRFRDAYWRYQTAYPSYQQIWTLSEHTGNDLAERRPGAQSLYTIIRHIGSGVDRTWFNPDSDTAGDAGLRAKCHASVPYVLAVLGEDERKGMLRLVRAMGRIRPRPRLIGAYRATRRHREEACELAAGLGVELVMTNEVSERTLRALYRGALLLAFPSTYEGFGLPALEAIACGTPVVGDEATSLPEVIGEAGVTCDSRNVGALAAAIFQVLGKPRESWRDAMAEQLDRHDWNRVGERAEFALCDLLTGGSVTCQPSL